MANPPTLTEDYRDCLQELVNVAMGQAADLLARVLNTFVILPIPNLAILTPADITMTLQSVGKSNSISGVSQGFIGGGIAGEAILLFNDTSFSDLARLLDYQGRLDKQAERELLMDTTNLLFGAFLRGLAAQIDTNFSFGAPNVMGQHMRMEEMFNPKTATWKHALVTEIHYALEDYNVNCDLLMVLTEDSIDLLFKKMDYLIS